MELPGVRIVNITEIAIEAVLVAAFQHKGNREGLPIAIDTRRKQSRLLERAENMTWQANRFVRAPFPLATASCRRHRLGKG